MSCEMVFTRREERKDTEEGKKAKIATPELSTNAPSKSTSNAFNHILPLTNRGKIKTRNAMFFRHVVFSTPEVGDVLQPYRTRGKVAPTM